MKKENIFLLTGENTYDLSQFLQKWMISSIQKYGEYNVVEYDFLEKSITELSAELLAPPFFGDGKRIFFIKNFPPAPPSRPFSEVKKKEISQMGEILQKIPQDTVAVLVSAKPDKRMAAYKTIIKYVGKIYEFAAWETDRSGGLSPHGLSQATEWIQKTAQKNGLHFSHENARFLLTFCGEDSWKLATEIKKLSLYADGNPVSENDIRSLCIPTEEIENFAFSSAFQTGKLEKVLETFEQLLITGEAPQAIMARDLMTTFRQLVLVQIAEKHGISAKEVGLHPFVFSKLKGFSRKFSEEKVRNAYHELLQMDIDSKTGKLPISPEKTDLFALRAEKVLIDFYQ